MRTSKLIHYNCSESTVCAGKRVRLEAEDLYVDSNAKTIIQSCVLSDIMSVCEYSATKTNKLIYYSYNESTVCAGKGVRLDGEYLYVDNNSKTIIQSCKCVECYHECV